MIPDFRPATPDISRRLVNICHLFYTPTIDAAYTGGLEYLLDPAPQGYSGPHGYVLTQGRYVGAAEVEGRWRAIRREDGATNCPTRGQMEESARLDNMIWANLEDLGYGK